MAIGETYRIQLRNQKCMVAWLGQHSRDFVNIAASAFLCQWFCCHDVVNPPADVSFYAAEGPIVPESVLASILVVQAK